MKRCQVCGHMSGHEASTCPLCGEASWSAVLQSKPRAKPGGPSGGKRKSTKSKRAPVEADRG